jgi:hypothetical protein
LKGKKMEKRVLTYFCFGLVTCIPWTSISAETKCSSFGYGHKVCYGSWVNSKEIENLLVQIYEKIDLKGMQHIDIKMEHDTLKFVFGIWDDRITNELPNLRNDEIEVLEAAYKTSYSNAFGYLLQLYGGAIGEKYKSNGIKNSTELSKAIDNDPASIAVQNKRFSVQLNLAKSNGETVKTLNFFNSRSSSKPKKEPKPLTLQDSIAMIQMENYLTRQKLEKERSEREKAREDSLNRLYFENLKRKKQEMANESANLESGTQNDESSPSKDTVKRSE